MDQSKFRQRLRLRGYPGAIAELLSIAFLLLALATAVATISFEWAAQWHDGMKQASSITHEMPEADYSLLWAAGKLAMEGQAARLYDGPSFASWRRQLFGAGLQRLDWLYPPPMVALGVAASRFPLLPGYYVWMALVCAISICVLRGAGLSWPVVLFGLFGPSGWRSLTLGQYAPLAAACVVAGLLRAPRAPVSAGVALTLATLKPHLGSLVPLVWISQRRWTAFSVASAGTLVLAACSTALLGVGIWFDFLHGGAVSGRELVETPTPNGYPLNAASVFWMARSFGAPIAYSYVAQVLSALLAGLVAWLVARRGSDSAAAAVTVCLTLLVFPYLYNSDLVGYSIVIAMLAERRPLHLLPIFLWLGPGISEVFTDITDKVVLPVFIALAAALAWREFGVHEIMEASRAESAVAVPTHVRAAACGR